MTVLSKKEYLTPLFKIDDNIYLSLHIMYNIVFNDNNGYCLNKYLILEGDLYE